MNGSLAVVSRFTTRALAPLFAAVAALDAQGAGTVGRVSAGVSFNASNPRGEFDAVAGAGWGLSGNALVQLDQNALLNWRTDAAFQIGGLLSEVISQGLSGGAGNQDNRRTSSNNLVSFVTGPQLMGASRAFMPYAAALGGFSVFWTSNSVRRATVDQPTMVTTNNNSLAWAYGGTAGFNLLLHEGTRHVHMDAGMRFLRHDAVDYVTAAEARASIAERREPRAVRSRADFNTFYLGVQIGAPRNTGLPPRARR